MSPGTLQSFQDLIRSTNAEDTNKISQLTVAYLDGTNETVIAPDVAPHPVPIPPSPTTKKFSDVFDAANNSGVFNLEPGVVYDMGSAPLKALRGSDIYIGQDPRYLDQPRPILKFYPGYKEMPAVFDPSAPGQTVYQALALGGKVTLAHLRLQFSQSGQLVLANGGSVRIDDVFVESGAGLVTMGGADLLDISNTDGVAAANMIYTGHGAHNGLLRMRNCNLRGGMINEHGLRTHLLDELDWDGGVFDGSGSIQGKDVLTIHELRKKGVIKNVTFKGWATIGGLTLDSPGKNDTALVNNLSLINVIFSPCIRSAPKATDPTFGKKNGARIYVLAGVNNFIHDSGSIEAFDTACYLWSNHGSSATRKPPTGTVRNIRATAPHDSDFVQGTTGVFNYKKLGNTINGKKL